MSIEERLTRIEEVLQLLVRQKVIKDWYTTAEVAESLQRAEWTVREWCRTGRVISRKAALRSRQQSEWIISHEELQRIRNEGLLPDPPVIRRRRLTSFGRRRKQMAIPPPLFFCLMTAHSSMSR